MKFVTYSSEVFRSFINDYKALVSAADKIEDGEEIKGKLLDTKFLMSMLFLADVNCFMSKFSKKVQISSNLPWDYSSSFDYMLGQIDLMMDEIIFIRNKLKEIIDSDYDGLFNGLSSHLFPFFMTVKDILTKTEYQGIPLKRRDQSQLRSFDPMYTLPGKQLERLVNFGVRYLAALRDNLTGRFDCHTMTMCRKFRELLDPSPYFYPSNNFSTKEPLDDVKTFKDFIKIIPFIPNEENFIGTLFFQLTEIKKIMLNLIGSYRATGDQELISNTQKLLKQIYGKADADSMAEARYFLSCVVCFPVSEAIVESWGSVIDKVISNKVAFKESSDESADITEKVVFIKTAGPTAGAVNNRKLFKRALTLMYKGSDYPKHFMRPHGSKGMCSKVVSKITDGSTKDTIFY